jgi:hypothetical protein
MSQAVTDVWLSVPSAIYLLLTGDMARAREFPDADSKWLAFLVARALSSAFLVPLDSAATEAQRIEALQAAKKRLSVEARDSYSAGLRALVEILSTGRGKAKGSRTPDGPIEPIDPAEFTRVRLEGVHAENKRTKRTVWHDLRISAQDLLKLRQAAQGAASRPSADGDKEAPTDAAPAKRQRPSDEDLDGWMSENLRPGAKRGPTIADCCEATGATVRAAIAAWKRVPADKRLRRGQKPPRPGQIEQ